ncbi:hypothetical protein COV19_04995 [Candidatus Woesearchaeota archaeon CG10_big_fil_rev_8_21_14_0_10_44_13]|nr:MAG: hypothetical protein COV19_04995 [Candidatus Woesearchaeota archaeon CG10_big_fil_rev_8_21_14_0_10_44_13]
MFERIIVNLQKRNIHNRAKKARELIKNNHVDHAEKIYNRLINEYKVFCRRATYFEKLSAYHTLLHLYNELSRKGEREEKPVEVGKRESGMKETGRKDAKNISAKNKVLQRKKEEKGRQKHAEEAGKQEKAGEMEGDEKEAAAQEGIRQEASGKEEAGTQGISQETSPSGQPQQMRSQITSPPAPIKKPSKMQFTTLIDGLYSYTQEKGKVNLMQASLKFKVSRDKIEEWAKILEEHGLIRMYYPAFTSPQLMSLEWMRKEEERKKKEAEEKRRKRQAKKKQ